MQKKLKYFALLSALILISPSLKSQNYVPNHSFEIAGDLSGATTNNYFNDTWIQCWVSPTVVAGYYSCGIWTPAPNCEYLAGLGVLPINGQRYGTINQGSGNPYDLFSFDNNLRNYFQTKLIKPLTAGVNYNFKMFVASSYFQATNIEGNHSHAQNLGVFFSNSQPMNIGSTTILPFVTPQINFLGTLMHDPVNDWIEISGTYTALGGERYLTIGDFDDGSEHIIFNGSPIGLPPLTMTSASPSVHLWVAIDNIRLTPQGSLDEEEIKVSIGSDTTICGPINFGLTASSGFDYYLWNTGATTQSIQITQPGTYWCRTDEFCYSCADTITVSQSALQNVNLGSDVSVCSNDFSPITLDAGSPFQSYQWSNGSNQASIQVAQSGTYWVEASYPCGIAKDTVTITILESPSPPLTQDTVVCQFEPLTANASGVDLLWYDNNNAGSSITPQVNTLVSGFQSYQVTQTVNGCESQKATFLAEIIEFPAVDFPEFVQFCAWESDYFGPTNSNWSYQWNDGLSTSPRELNESGIYWLSATNFCGTASDTVKISKDPCECFFYLPNAFTPNLDPPNEYFQPVFDCRIADFEMQIYNRWGEVVFSSSEPTVGWNGKDKNNVDALPGLYAVTIRYKDFSRNTITVFNGSVSLIR